MLTMVFSGPRTARKQAVNVLTQLGGEVEPDEHQHGFDRADEGEAFIEVHHGDLNAMINGVKALGFTLRRHSNRNDSVALTRDESSHKLDALVTELAELKAYMKAAGIGGGNL